jgi:hypothetical protein
MPSIDFYPEQEKCPHCGARLHVQKTCNKTVATMDIGPFVAKETVLRCPHDQAVFTSHALHALTPIQGTFGFDVIEHVGRALFVSCRTEREVMIELAARNVPISEREIGYLGRKFIIYLALAHRESHEPLHRSLLRSGGYILHVDGTCEGGSPHLFCGLDGISQWVLDSIKIPSEKKELLVPFFRRIEQHYGTPLAVVNDMGPGILAAIAEVFPGVPDCICHFHFLRDIGRDLLLEDYQGLTQGLRGHNVRPLLRRKAKYFEKKVTESSQTLTELKISVESGQLKTACLIPIPAMIAYTLIHWAFEAPRQSRGLGFPFDRPHVEFFRRLKHVHALLAQIRHIQLRNQAEDNRPLFQLWQLLEGVVQDKALNEAVARLETKAVVFDKLRQALRIALPESNNGLNDPGEDTDIQTIEKNMCEFRNWLQCDESRRKTYTKMIEQIDKYWDKLFAEPIVVHTPDGICLIVPQRTNNILESFFRGEKRQGRKKTGTASLTKTLKMILADTSLVRNLKHEQYCQIILNGCATLAERFSQIDAKLVQEQLEQANNTHERIPQEVKKMIGHSDLPDRISALLMPMGNIHANCDLR